MSKSRSQLIDYLKCIDITGKTVLDVGSGSKEHWAKNWVKGKPKKYITCDVQRFEGVDFEFDLNIRHNYIDEFKTTPQRCEVTFCLETLEHCWNPIQAIENLDKFTTEVLYISTPFINPIHDEVDYLRYTEEWYQMVLPKFGFTHIDIKRRTTDSPLLPTWYQEEGMRMSKIRIKKGESYKLKDVGYFVEARR